ncbi:unnamed protein product, partial [Polarella glacialis]
ALQMACHTLGATMAGSSCSQELILGAVDPTVRLPTKTSEMFKVGEAVRYLSRSSSSWIPAVVKGHNEELPGNGVESPWLSYCLDVQPRAHP